MTRPLHIASVCRTLPSPTDPTGGVFVLNRLRGMSDYAHVSVIQPLPYMPVVRPLPAWADTPSRTIDGLTIRHAPMLYAPGLFKSADGALLARSIEAAITALHRETPIDAIDAHFGYPEGVGCSRIARKLGVPLFVTIRGFENEYVHRRGIGGQMVEALASATGCISVSESLRKLALRHGVEASRIRVIHNAIDSGIFTYGDPEESRAQLGIAPASLLVVSVGHLVSRKRHHVLLEAFSRLRLRRPDAVLAIIGARSFERAYPDRLAALAHALGIAEAVRFVGDVPPTSVAAWLRAADVFALATAREGCCNAVLEALATGLPVVTTSAGDNSFFVKDGINGQIVPIDDADALAAALEAVLARSWDRPAIAAQLIEQAGSWAGVGARVVTFMQERLATAASAASAPLQASA